MTRFVLMSGLACVWMGATIDQVRGWAAATGSTTLNSQPPSQDKDKNKEKDKDKTGKGKKNKKAKKAAKKAEKSKKDAPTPAKDDAAKTSSESGEQSSSSTTGTTTSLGGISVATTPSGDQEVTNLEPYDKEDPSLYPRVKLETSLGNIVLELNGEKAPITVRNFVRYVQDKQYDGTVFHRVIKTFMIQGGGFLPSMEEKKEGLRDPILLEAGNGLKNERGTIAMARTGDPDSATSQFFISVVDNPFLDAAPPSRPGYTVFGKVIEGMDVVDAIRDAKVVKHPKYPSPQPVTPEEAIVIKSVSVVSEFDSEKLSTKADQKAEDLKNASQKALEEFVANLEKETGKKMTKTESGLMYVDIKEGEGETPKEDSKITAHYTGWLLDGTKFDSSKDREPFTFTLKQGLIKGWIEGASTMKAGGHRKLIIPHELGYGLRGAGNVIPPKATLVFELEVLKIENADAPKSDEGKPGDADAPKSVEGEPDDDD